MSMPQSFRDPFVSLYQSVVDHVVRAASDLTGLASRPGLENGLVHAAEQVAALKAKGAATLPDAPPDGIAQDVWQCAKLGFALMEARARGDTTTAQSIEDVMRYNVCDPAWAGAVANYVQYFGPDGGRATIPYIRPATVGPVTVPLMAGAKVALIADWGTGTDIAVNLLKQVALQDPDVVIHLGDIYYSGTAEECDVNFKRIVDTVLQRDEKDVPVYTLSGNHDMYSGGAGYYGLIASLNGHPWVQPASFFCLRNDDWQFIAMDTGLHDSVPIIGEEVLTFIEPDEEAWIIDRLSEFNGKTILMSHHQLFSAFSQIGPRGTDGTFTAWNPKLVASYQRFAKAAKQPIAAWFWGHEHNLSVYDPCQGLQRGRCIGNGAVPVFADADTPPFAPMPGIVNPPKVADVQLGVEGRTYMHGFTVVRLGAGSAATAEYYEDNNGTTPMFTEDL
ncbi:metallophosphoesterase family protein [Paraburkholderia sp. GAS42]|uniref:metallophosphoesterase family protein n=1 Tax=Paraburkholderia sp. GAS42 TaxID=3035135 RepID=UPI003D1B7299